MHKDVLEELQHLYRKVVVDLRKVAQIYLDEEDDKNVARTADIIFQLQGHERDIRMGV